MIVPLLQVLFAAIRTVSRSALNIMLYSMLSRIFNTWFGFNTLITFFCSAYCLSKMMGYFQRTWLHARLKNKKPEEKILVDELTWQSPTTITASLGNGKESVDKFEADWKLLLDDDAKNVFPRIVDIPFKNGWLFFATLTAIDYQMNTYNYSYTQALLRTIGFLIVLISGASVRYQTLLEREKQKFFNLMVKKRDEIERYIVYSNKNIPVASICLQIINSPDKTAFMVQLCQLHSKFDDYISDIGSFVCQRLYERARSYANDNRTSVCIIWSIPTCKQYWIYGIKANKFTLANTYKDYSFMPLVNSHVEQYEYLYEYEDLSAEPALDQESELPADEAVEDE